jgi:hypothetical protein
VFGRPPSTLLAIVKAAFAEGEDWALAGFTLLIVLAHLWSQNTNVM